MEDNPGSPILDRDGLSRALASRGMAAEAVEASVAGLHRNGGIWEFISAQHLPPPQRTRKMAGAALLIVGTDALAGGTLSGGLGDVVR